jgi:hypothetical protein
MVSPYRSMSRDHHEVAGLQRCRCDLQVVRRGVRHVVGRRRRGLAVLADVGPQHREVAGVPRPTPVVDLTAEHADVSRRCVNDTNVLDLPRLE